MLDMLISLGVIMLCSTGLIIGILIISKLESITTPIKEEVNYKKLLEEAGIKVVEDVNIYDPKGMPCVVVRDKIVKVYTIEDRILNVRYIEKNEETQLKLKQLIKDLSKI